MNNANSLRKPNGMSLYRYYVSIKIHFTVPHFDLSLFPSFPKAKLTKESYEKRNDKGMFEKIAKSGALFKTRDEMIEFLIIAFLNHRSPSTLWIGDLFEGEKEWALEQHKRFIKTKEGFTSRFHSDIMHLRDRMIDNGFKAPMDVFTRIEDDTDFPIIINELKSKNVTFESVVTMNRVINFLPSCDRCINTHAPQNFVWSTFHHKLNKYQSIMKPFFRTSEDERNTVNDIMKSVFIRELAPKHQSNPTETKQ